MTALARQINTLHNQAMEHTDLALLAQRRGDEDEALSQFQMAAAYESRAANLAPVTVQPTHSVLHRSAATLALDCGDIPEAERLIRAAFDGNPPSEIASELHDLKEIIDGIREGIAEADAGDIHDISTLWDGIDDDESDVH